MTAGDIQAEVSYRWPDAADDMAALTDCYQNSRYGKKVIGEDELKYAETLYGRIRNKIISQNTEGDAKHARNAHPGVIHGMAQSRRQKSKKND
jgi:hypothetical protein